MTTQKNKKVLSEVASNLIDVFKKELQIDVITNCLQSENEQDGVIKKANKLKFEMQIKTAHALKLSSEYYDLTFKQALKDKGEKMSKEHFFDAKFNVKSSQFSDYIALAKADIRVLNAYKEQCRLGTLSYGLGPFVKFMRKLSETMAKKGENETISKDEIGEAANDSSKSKESNTIFSYNDKRAEKKVSFTIDKGENLKHNNATSLDDIRASLLSMLEFINKQAPKGAIVKAPKQAPKKAQAPKQASAKAKQAPKQTSTKAKQAQYANGFKTMAEA
jgi:hypothetical protein